MELQGGRFDRFSDPSPMRAFIAALATESNSFAPFPTGLGTPMVGLYPTLDEPMKGIVADLRAAEAQAPVPSASIAHGLPRGGVADVGTRVLVIADADPAVAAQQASRLAQRLYDTLQLDFEHLPHTRRDGHFFARVDDPWAGCDPPAAAIFDLARRGEGTPA